MRRKDREVSQLADKLAILDQCQVCRVAMCVNEQPYIVPLNFGYEMADSRLILYLHGAAEGKKVDMLRQNPNVCFEVDTEHGLVGTEHVKNYSYTYASVIGFGVAEFIEEPAQKLRALQNLVEKVAGHKNFQPDEQSLKQVMVFKITCSEFTGKRRPAPEHIS